MIAGIAHVEIAARIQGNAPGIVELPGRSSRSSQDLNRLIVCIENLHAAVAELAHELVSGGIDPHVVGGAHLASILTGTTVSAQPFSIRRKDLHTMVAGIGNVNAIGAIYAQAFGAVELTRPGSGRSKE